jgi:hypothetical protein
VRTLGFGCHVVGLAFLALAACGSTGGGGRTDGGGLAPTPSASDAGADVQTRGASKLELLDARVEHAMAPMGREIVLFGGKNADVLDDTWV